MKRIQGLAAVLAVAALAGGAAVAAASSNGGGTGTTTTTGTTGTTTTTPATPQRPHGHGPGPAFGFGGAGGYGFFDTATKTALKETFTAVETARKTATDAGKAPDDVRDAAIAAAKTRLDQAVTDGALTKAQAAAVLAALTKEAAAKAAVIDAAAGVLKLTPTELAKRLASGDRLDEIAKAQGVDLKDVFTAIQKVQPGPGWRTWRSVRFRRSRRLRPAAGWATAVSGTTASAARRRVTGGARRLRLPRRPSHRRRAAASRRARPRRTSRPPHSRGAGGPPSLLPSAPWRTAPRVSGLRVLGPVAVGARGLHERAEERCAGSVGILLGMPEHSEAERLVGILDRLDLSVVRARGDDEPLAQAPDALVVRRVHGDRSGRAGTRRACPLSVSTSWRPKTPASGRCGVRSVVSARCWMRSPPAATSSSCMPRQIPSSGSLRRRASSSSASSNASRRSCLSPVSGCASGEP